jgi:hypothetical protein
MKTTRISLAVLMISSAFVLSGCGQLLEKLRGGGDAGSDAAAEDSGAVADTTDAAADQGDAAADAAVPSTTFHAGDQIPTFNADNTAAQKEINAANYKAQLQTLDTQVKALK